MNEKKKQIILVAEKLFAKNGFTGTSVRDISREAGVNIAMISYYFGSKEKLLTAIFHYRSDYLQMKIDSVIKDDEIDLLDKLDFMIEGYVNKFWDNRLLHQIILREQNLMDNDEIRQFIYSRRKSHFRTMMRFINRGQDLGRFKKDVDIQMLYVLLPGVTKDILFNEDLYLNMMEEEEKRKVSTNELKVRIQDFLKSTYHQLLLEN